MGDDKLVDRDDTSPEFDVFISYAVADRDVVKPFVTTLKRDGFKVWIDYEQMAGGVPVINQLADGIARSSHMIVCLSDTYLGREWTNAELQFSMTRDPSGRGTCTIPALFRPLTSEIPLTLRALTICDLTDRDNNYEQQYELVTKKISRQVASPAPGKAEIGTICREPFDHLGQPELALFLAYRAYRELCLFLYRQEIGDVPAHADFSWITDRLLMRPSLPAEVRNALATMEGYGRQVVPGAVNGPPVTSETIDPPLRALATLNRALFPDWHQPDERVDVWDGLPPGEDGTRHLPGTDYVLRAPELARATLGPLYRARDTSRSKSMTILLVDPPLPDDRMFRRQLARFDQAHRDGVLVPNEIGEFEIDLGRRHYLTMPTVDGVSAVTLVEDAGKLPPRAAYELALGIAEVLRDLHDADPPVMHGDVVLANVFVRPIGTVLLCPGRSITQTKAGDLAGLAALLDELLPNSLAEPVADCTTAARACRLLRDATVDLPAADSLSSVYRNSQGVPQPPPAVVPKTPELRETCRIEIDSKAAWPLGDGRLVVWERGTGTLVVREGAETIWRDSQAVAVRRTVPGPDGQLAIGCWDGTIRCFVDGAPVVAARMDGTIGDLCFVGDTLVAGSWKQSLWRFGPDGQRRELLDVKAGVHRIAAAEGRDRFAVADLSGGLSIYADNRRVVNLPTVGFVTDLAYAGTRLVLLTGETLTSLRLDGSIGVSEASRGARRLLPGPLSGHCTLLVRTGSGAETWLIDEAERHVRDRVFPDGRMPIRTCGVPGRFIVSEPDGGCAYWRDGEQQSLWRNAITANLSLNGCLVAVSRPGVVELYEDFR
jgi:hypothetical protein